MEEDEILGSFTFTFWKEIYLTFRLLKENQKSLLTWNSVFVPPDYILFFQFLIW